MKMCIELIVTCFALVVLAATVRGDADSGVNITAYSEAVVKPNHEGNSSAGYDPLRGEGLFADIKIYYIKGPGYLEVKKSWLGWGKWVKDFQHLSEEVSSPDGMTMTAWGEYHITATGRQASPSGCEGMFDLYFNGNERAVYVYFDTTFMGTPVATVEKFSDKFTVSHINIGSSSIMTTIYISWVGDLVDVVDTK